MGFISAGLCENLCVTPHFNIFNAENRKEGVESRKDED